MIDLQCHPPHPHPGRSMWKYKRQNAAKKQKRQCRPSPSVMSDALLPETPLSAEQLHRALLNNWTIEHLNWNTKQYAGHFAALKFNQMYPLSLQNNCTQYHVKIIVCKKLWPNAMLYTNLPLHIAKLPQLQTTMHCIHRLQTNCDAPIINVLWWTTALKSVGSAISYHCAANPNSHCIWGRGGLLCGWKGSSKDKEVQKKLSNLSKLPNFVKVQNTIRVDFQ